MFRKLLIANRGEIACRVIATVRRLGIATAAVYSEADANALHVAQADEAWPIGPAPARESYLDIERIIGAARAAGADALHPGYGFLSENPALAEACAAVGITFVGPPAAAIRAMGSKAEAKALMARAGVPLVPGYHGADQDLPRLTDEAARIGFPVLVKASAGGGGKGMRVVASAAELPEAVEGARREALAAFGDGRLLVERYLTQPRHIEIQVFADRHGNAVYLFERDCSVQRRHQKVIEEAPAPGLPEAQRQAMGEAAVAAARAVDYVGAGTVEFIAEGGTFYFMEMNTRLQVEHPVTEFITGLDLVEWQLRVAAGEELPLRQEALRIHGHAIEARIYAEDPAREFLPSIGTLLHVGEPAASAQVRVDTGVRAGDAITPYYDPMIAKLIVHGADRGEALRRLRAALDDYEVVGVRTNLDLLRAVASQPDFAAGPVATTFIAAHSAVLAPSAVAEAETALALTAAAMAAWDEARRAGAPGSPWAEADAWTVDGDGFASFSFRKDGENEVAEVRLRPDPGGGARLELPGGFSVVAAWAGRRLVVDGVARRVVAVPEPDRITVVIAGRNHVLARVDPWARPSAAAAGLGRLVAPIPARLTRALVRAGDAVAKGQSLVVLEAMKTELTLAAPADGMVTALCFSVGDMVEEGAEIVTLGPVGGDGGP